MVFDVFVNPHPRFLSEWYVIAKDYTEEKQEDLAAWFSFIFSKGENKERHISASEMNEIIEGAKDTDFILWLTDEVLGMISDYQKKK